MSDILSPAFKYWRERGKTAAKALELARDDVCNGKERYSAGVTGWNPASPDGARFIESVEGAGLRLVGYADEIVRLNHKGWFCDTFESDVYRGVVMMLPGKNKLNRYLAGYEDPHNPGTYRIDMARGIFEGLGSDYYPSNRHDDNAARDAARAADDFAEKEAESAREWDEAWQNGSRWADLRNDVTVWRKEALTLIREIKAAGKAFSPAICETLKDKLSDMRDKIADARKKMDELANFSAWAIQDGLHEVFNDGAGYPVVKA